MEEVIKLFDDFKAVKFPEENMIFITHNEYHYYIYDVKCGKWKNMKKQAMF